MRQLVGLGALLVPCALAAQTAATVQRAVNSITAEDVRHHIGVLADDSMLGRATPSPQLEQVASYVADQFRRFGLKPAGDNGGYLQRYTVAQRVVNGHQRHSHRRRDAGDAEAWRRCVSVTVHTATDA